MDDWKSVLVEFAALEVEFGAELSEQFAVTELDTGPMLDIAAQGLESLALPIPSIFYSLHDGPFERCLVCKTELLTAPVEYEIVRLFRLEEPVTEYALCVGCCDPLWELRFPTGGS